MEEENIFHCEETSTAALTRNARTNTFDLNQPLGFDLNEPPPSEPPTPPHTEGDVNGSERIPRIKIKYLFNDQRQAIYMTLLKKSVNEKLKWGTTKAVTNDFSITMRNVQRIWKRAKETSNQGNVDVSHFKTKNCGRKRVQVDLQQMKNVPLSKWTTIRSTAYALRVPKSTLHRFFKDGKIRRNSNSIKPLLTNKNMKSRVEFCLSMLDKNCLSNNFRFVNMENIVHIREKWFYLTKKSETYYLVAGEEEPYMTCKSKNFVMKVMFLAAVARSRFDIHENEIFSGTIGIYPLVTKEPSRRSSVNRVTGTLETKVMTSVGRNIIRSYMIEKVLRDIGAKWPDGNMVTIFIQQDNARTHLDPNDIEFCQAAAQYGFDIRLMCQPSNSPDLKILDLGFLMPSNLYATRRVQKTLMSL